MNKSKIVGYVFFLIIFVTLLVVLLPVNPSFKDNAFISFRFFKETPAEDPPDFLYYSVDNQPLFTSKSPMFLDEEIVVRNGSTFSNLLRNHGLDVKLVTDLVDAAKPLFSFRELIPQTLLKLRYSLVPKHLVNLIYQVNEVKLLDIYLDESLEKWTAQWIEKPITTKLVVIKGSINSSLWESMAMLGLSAEIITKLASIFAWQIDFERQVKPQDEWSILVEEQYVDDKFYKYGSIIAASYELSGERYNAIFHEKQSHYYDENGASMEALFLKSPLTYGRISSPFQKKRFHPILKINRPHNGVDYAAPTGTPVHSVGDGRVLVCSNQGGSGNMIMIQHNSIYKTAYKHLSRFASQLKIGSKVSQGDVIGYVGQTGLATGPHLHFEFYEKEKYMDPLGIKFPRVLSLSKHELERFKLKSKQLLRAIDSNTTDGIAVSG